MDFSICAHKIGFRKFSHICFCVYVYVHVVFTLYMCVLNLFIHQRDTKWHFSGEDQEAIFYPNTQVNAH